MMYFITPRNTVKNSHAQVSNSQVDLETSNSIILMDLEQKDDNLRVWHYIKKQMTFFHHIDLTSKIVFTLHTNWKHIAKCLHSRKLVWYQVCADQEVVGEAPHPPMSQDCPKHQGVAQDWDHLAIRWILSELKATKATQYYFKSIMLKDTLHLKLKDRGAPPKKLHPLFSHCMLFLGGNGQKNYQGGLGELGTNKVLIWRWVGVKSEREK